MQNLLDNQDEAVANLVEGGNATASASQLLVDWANAREGWIRKTVALVLTTRSPIEPEALGELYAALRI